jgi:hypothetical protein
MMLQLPNSEINHTCSCTSIMKVETEVRSKDKRKRVASSPGMQ